MSKNLRVAKSSGYTHRRGDERRHRLLEAAIGLLEKTEPRELTFAAVCASAGVPTGSARFFYPDINALLGALISELGKKHDAFLLRPLRSGDLESWRTLVACLIDRSATFQRANPVHAKLTISGQTLPELKRIDRQADFERSAGVISMIDEHFVVPKVQDLGKIAYLATEIVDLAFTLSMNEVGRITPQWLNYAKASCIAVLSHHFGGELERRPTFEPQEP